MSSCLCSILALFKKQYFLQAGFNQPVFSLFCRRKEIPVKVPFVGGREKCLLHLEFQCIVNMNDSIAQSVLSRKPCQKSEIRLQNNLKILQHSWRAIRHWHLPFQFYHLHFQKWKCCLTRQNELLEHFFLDKASVYVWIGANIPSPWWFAKATAKTRFMYSVDYYGYGMCALLIIS